MRLESENDNLAQELVLSKVTLRQEMDRVSVSLCSVERNYLSLVLQLEERIDTLSKESRAHKTSADLSQQMHREVKEELQQVRVTSLKPRVQASGILGRVDRT